MHINQRAKALLAASPSPSDSVVSSMPSIPAPVAINQAGDEERAWTVNWVGVLLMTFGFVCLLSADELAVHVGHVRIVAAERGKHSSSAGRGVRPYLDRVERAARLCLIGIVVLSGALVCWALFFL
jgi:hypothetical protein